MNIISCDYIVTFDEELQIVKNKSVAYEKQIVKIDSKDTLLKEYPGAKILEFGKNSVLLPGLINTHIHLEYIKNKNRLSYGEFIKWLSSVVKYREELVKLSSDEAIKEALFALLKSGTTTIGEISSFGEDIEPCKNSPINVVLFNEILGSNPAAVDILYQDFLQRYYKCLSIKDERFIPAISVHSPYSTHPILAKKALKLAKDGDCIVSTHLLESKAERDWLEKANGGFKDFLEKFTPNPKPLTTIDEYIELFSGIPTLFTHLTYATKEEIKKIDSEFFITSCPVSNRLLENKKLDLKDIRNLTIATDGLTSNISLNLWDELRSALFIHDSIDADWLSKKLLTSVTKNASNALRLNKGVIKEGFDADMIVVDIEQDFDDIETIYKWLILHTKEVEKTIILGEEV